MTKKDRAPPPARMVPPGHTGENPLDKGRRIAKEMGIPFDKDFDDTRPRGHVIEEIEAKNASVVDSHKKLPKEGHEFLTEHGFQFGKVLDDLFIEVTTWPAGFAVRHLEDARAFEILDAHEVRVAVGFVKDSHDRLAYLSPVHEM